MKLQCPCGAKYAFDVSPDMVQNPVKFVCPSCGQDSSAAVNSLIRQQFAAPPATAATGGQPAPVAFLVGSAPSTVSASPPPEPAAASSPEAPAPLPMASAYRPPPMRAAPPRSTATATESADVQEGTPCAKHPGEYAVEQCRVCGKPICPKCMQMFGYVCSPLCKAKAESRGLHIPVFAGQKSVVEARLWRKVAWVGITSGVLLVGSAGLWFWYTFFGCAPRVVYSVRFDRPKFAGESAQTGKDMDQLVFLHGGVLFRHDMKLKKQLWSRDLIDHKKIAEDVQKELKDMAESRLRAADAGHVSTSRFPTAEELQREEEISEARGMHLYVRGENIWIASHGKLARYDYNTGAPGKEVTFPAEYGGAIARGDELTLMNRELGRIVVSHFNLLTGETRTVELGGTPGSAVAGTAVGGKPALGAPTASIPPRTAISNVAAAGPGRSPGKKTELAGLPITPGKNVGKPMDPAKVAQQAQDLPYAAKVALPALVANTMTQDRLLREMGDGEDGSTGGGGPGFNMMMAVTPTKDSFLQYSAKLLEAKSIERVAMKEAPKKSALEGNVTAGRSLEVASEMLNEMQRSYGGGVVREDASRYLMTVRQPDTGETWSGEVVGSPRLLPLDTVNVVAANKTLIVLDKHMKKMWQASLTYNVRNVGGLDEEDSPYGRGPCVERKGSLYVFDEGVLTAFDLATGNARWRLPSVGIAGLFFDDKDMIYVNTTTASPENLKYSMQIDVSQRIGSVIMKVNSKDGKVIWSAQPGGLINRVSGGMIFTVDSLRPNTEDDQEVGAFQTPPYVRIRRISPKNGRALWEHFQDRGPWDIQIEGNTIRLVFKKEVQVLKFYTF